MPKRKQLTKILLTHKREHKHEENIHNTNDFLKTHNLATLYFYISVSIKVHIKITQTYLPE